MSIVINDDWPPPPRRQDLVRLYDISPDEDFEEEETPIYETGKCL